MKRLIIIPLIFFSMSLFSQSYTIIKPSQLPAATTVNPTDIFIVNQGTTTKKITYTNFLTKLLDSVLYITPEKIIFDTTASVPSYLAGNLYYDQTTKTLALQTGSGVTQNIGQELPLYVHNVSGSDIKNGNAIAIIASGSDEIRVRLADKDDALTSYSTLGLATTDIDHGSFGYVTTYGLVHDLNTNSFTEGQYVYMGDNGGLRSATPDTGHIIALGMVIHKHSSVGIIGVFPQQLSHTSYKILNRYANKGVLLDTISGARYYNIDTTGRSNYWLPNKEWVKREIIARSSSGSYVDLTTDQAIAGEKTFFDTAFFTKAIVSDKTISLVSLIDTASITVALIGDTANMFASTDSIPFMVKMGGNMLLKTDTGGIYQEIVDSTAYTDYHLPNVDFVLDKIKTGGRDGILNIDSVNLTGGAKIDGNIQTGQYGQGHITLDNTSDPNISIANAGGDSLNITPTEIALNGTNNMQIGIYDGGLSTYMTSGSFNIIDGGLISTWNAEISSMSGNGDTTLITNGTVKATENIKVGHYTNFVKIDPLNSFRMYGTSTVFDDLFFPFSTGSQGSAGYPAFDVDSMYYSFTVDTAAPTVCMMYFTIQMPHSWKEGSTIYPHVHYKHEIGVGTPTFKMKYKWYYGTTQKDWKWYTMSTASATTDKTVQRVSGSGGISGSGMGISSIIVCAVYLTSQTGTGDVHAYQFDIHIEKDALGSNTETSK